MRIASMTVLVTCLALATVRPTLASPPDDERAIKALLETQVAAWNHGDLEGYMKGYWRSPLLSFFGGGDRTHGYDETLARYRRRYQSEGRKMGTLSFTDLAIDMLASDAAVARGGWHLDFADGKTAEGLFTLIVRRKPDGWRIVHDHSSVATEPVQRWFARKGCVALAIEQHRSISQHEVVASARLDDIDAVGGLIARIEEIPTDGKKMVKPGPDMEHTDLVFSCAGGTQTIEILGGRFKTPSTGFNNENAHESSLVEDITALLAPDVGKRLIKAKGTKLQLKTFSITYLGSATSDGAPATVSATTERYAVTDAHGHTQTLAVSSGQTPPAPASFVVDGARFSLLTYEDGGERLFPRYFAIRRQPAR